MAARTVNIDTPNPSAPVEYDPGFKAYLARKIKEVTKVPVISVGRYVDPYVMDEVIARGDADLDRRGQTASGRSRFPEKRQGRTSGRYTGMPGLQSGMH